MYTFFSSHLARRPVFWDIEGAEPRESAPEEAPQGPAESEGRVTRQVQDNTSASVADALDLDEYGREQTYEAVTLSTTVEASATNLVQKLRAVRAKGALSKESLESLANLVHDIQQLIILLERNDLSSVSQLASSQLMGTAEGKLDFALWVYIFDFRRYVQEMHATVLRFLESEFSSKEEMQRAVSEIEEEIYEKIPLLKEVLKYIQE